MWTEASYETDETGKRVWVPAWNQPDYRTNPKYDFKLNYNVPHQLLEAAVRSAVQYLNRTIEPVPDEMLMEVVMGTLADSGVPREKITKPILHGVINQALQLIENKGNIHGEGSPDLYKPEMTDASRLHPATEGDHGWTELPEEATKQIPGWGKFPGYIGDPHYPARMRWTHQASERGVFYHVAPAEHRESILQHGLQGQQRDEYYPTVPIEGQWPDEYEKHGQPPGNYLFSTPAAAHEYAYGRAHKRGVPNQEDLQLEHGIYDGNVLDDIDDSEPEGWDEEKQGDWYDSEPYEELQEKRNNDYGRPYDHETDRHLMGPHLQGHDIWKVQIDPDHQQVQRDPEESLIHRNPGYKVQEHPDESELSAWEAIHEVKKETDDEGYYEGDTTANRWYTPHAVAPHQLQLHQHVPVWEHGNEQDGTSAMEDQHWHDESYQSEIPEPFARVPFKRPFGRTLPSHRHAWRDAVVAFRVMGSWMGDDPSNPTRFWRSPQGDEEVHIKNFSGDQSIGKDPYQAVVFHDRNGNMHFPKRDASGALGGFFMGAKMPSRPAKTSIHGALDAVAQHADDHGDVSMQMLLLDNAEKQRGEQERFDQMTRGLDDDEPEGWHSV